ncbi:hypothetical protein NPIL_237191, partial [Nephila pilipes]
VNYLRKTVYTSGGTREDENFKLVAAGSNKICKEHIHGIKETCDGRRGLPGSVYKKKESKLKDRDRKEERDGKLTVHTFNYQR